ncbi:MAG: hypothetical protein ACRYFS_19705 [Janthinobacterium lividum]
MGDTAYPLTPATAKDAAKDRAKSIPEAEKTNAIAAKNNAMVRMRGKQAFWHPVPTQVVDALMPGLKDTELRVLLVVLRQTWGWKADWAETKQGRRTKRRDWLSHSQLCRRTGRGSDAVSGAVASLTASGLIIVEDAAGNLLPTPEERQRSLGRLYYRPGEMWPDKET